jgi:hypothetical protein
MWIDTSKKSPHQLHTLIPHPPVWIPDIIFTMIFQRSLILALFSLCAAPVDSFAFTKPSTFASFPTSTCLRAEAEKEQEAEVAPDTDILNSPGFLKRKIDVLNSDIVKTDLDIEVAKTQLDEGKAEWETLIVDLQKEVRPEGSVCFICLKGMLYFIITHLLFFYSLV